MFSVKQCVNVAEVHIKKLRIGLSFPLVDSVPDIDAWPTIGVSYVLINANKTTLYTTFFVILTDISFQKLSPSLP